MTINANKAIEYMQQLKVNCVKYAMTGSRTGSDGTADCSGAVYASLRFAGASNAGWVLNTESLHDWLVLNGFTCITYNRDWEAQKGDIFIWGQRGWSAGAGGRTGIFVDHDNVIYCNYGNNGITVNDYYRTW